MSQTNEGVVDALFHNFDQADVPGAAVMVIKDSKPVFAKGYGLADLKRKTPCTANTNFRLASVTKQFTAMAVLILAEQEKLFLEDHKRQSRPRYALLQPSARKAALATGVVFTNPARASRTIRNEVAPEGSTPFASVRRIATDVAQL